MPEPTRKTALITGATSGIGYELSKVFAQHGYDLALVARDSTRLGQVADEIRQVYGCQVKVIAKDLSLADAAEEIYAELGGETIDVLVNNAGSTVYGPFCETDLAQELRMVQLNLVSLTVLTKLFLPGMIQRGQAKILNVGSTGSFIPVPLNAVYSATKAYVLSLSEALAEELRGTGVSVTTLCPGATLTNFQVSAKMEKSRMFRSTPMLPRPVAEAGYRALMAGKRLVVVGFQNQLIVLLPKILPLPVVTRVVKYFMSEA